MRGVSQEARRKKAQAELDIRQSRAPGKGGFFLKDHAEPRVWAVNAFIAYVQFAIRCRNQSADDS